MSSTWSSGNFAAPLIFVLATSHYLFGGDGPVSYRDGAAPSNDGPMRLVVRDFAGQRSNPCVGNGRPLPASDSVRNVAYGNAVISDLLFEPFTGEPILTVDVSIWREDDSAVILSLCALPRILRVLTNNTSRRVGPRWFSIAKGGRSHARRGPSATPFASTGDELAAIADVQQASPAGFWINFGVEHRASSLIDLADWTVAINVPSDIFFEPVHRSLLVLLMAGSGTLVLVLVLAVDIGRRIAGPIVNLAGVAGALGNGRHVAPALTGINEADLVAHVLHCANEDLNRRTTELTRTVGVLRQREKQLQELSGDLRRAFDERTELLNRMVSAQESERQRIARELHDHLGQYLAAMMLGLNAVEEGSRRKGAAHRAIADLKAMTSATGREVHQLSWQLRPTALDDLGLEAAMANYLEQWSERFKLDVNFVGNLRKKRLSAPIEITLYRVLQEGMTNVAKHAKAASISVILDADESETRLIIEDDGTGFDQETSSSPASAVTGLGLIGIRERLALVGGSMIIETASNCGTTIVCRIPA